MISASTSKLRVKYEFNLKMPGLKRPRQSFTFEYKLRVIARADEIGNRAAAQEFEMTNP